MGLRETVLGIRREGGETDDSRLDISDLAETGLEIWGETILRCFFGAFALLRLFSNLYIAKTVIAVHRNVSNTLVEMNIAIETDIAHAGSRVV
jgi:hypothetical protein